MCQVTTHGLCEPINLTKLWFLTFHETGKVITKYYLWMGGKCIVHWSIYSLPLQFQLVSLISLPEETHCESPEKAIKIINLFPARTWTQIFQSKFLHLTIGLMPLLQVTCSSFKNKSPPYWGKALNLMTSLNLSGAILTFPSHEHSCTASLPKEGNTIQNPITKIFFISIVYHK